MMRTELHGDFEVSGLRGLRDILIAPSEQLFENRDEHRGESAVRHSMSREINY